MSLTNPSLPGVLPRHATGARGLRGLLLGLALAGCSSAPLPRASIPAHLLVNNLTDYSWHLGFSVPQGHTEIAAVLVRPRSLQTVDLAGGDYSISQSAEMAEGEGKLSRQTQARLESGKTYHWRLVTLLSKPSP